MSKKGRQEAQKLSTDANNQNEDAVNEDVLNGNDLEDDCVPLDAILSLVCVMPLDRLLALLHVVDNILDLMSSLSDLGFYDELCEDVDYVDEDQDLVSDDDRCSHAGDACTIDVTEDDLIQLAAETQQDDGEKEDLIEGLRTLKRDTQEEVVICLRSKFIEMKTNKEELNESDEDLLDEEDADVIKEEDDLDLLPPEKYKTCPASSFEAALKNRSAPKGSDSELERPRSGTTAAVNSPPSTAAPKKSKSLPDIVEDKKSYPQVSRARKIFEKASSQANLSSKPKAPWIPTGKHISPKIKPKPAKFFTSTPKPTPESPTKGLRKRVLTRAAEINKKSVDDEEKTTTKYGRKPRSLSKTIEEKAKVFLNESKYGVVYSRPANVAGSSEKRPPWRYGKSKAPSVPLPTIKPFIMRKAARKHELGLNRDQLKDLQIGLSQVLDHSHQSCPAAPARFNTLASSPLGRIPSSASRAAAATYASSNKPQKDYQGCEVCRLKEAMRNSPVSHRLKSAPHRCSSQPNLIKVPAVKPKIAVKPKQQSKSKLTVALAPSDKTSKDEPFHSYIVPVAVFSSFFFLLLSSFFSFFYFSLVLNFFFHLGLIAFFRSSFHCLNTEPKNTAFLLKSWQKLIKLPFVVIPLELYEEGKSLWVYLSKIFWKDAIATVRKHLPENFSQIMLIFRLLLQDVQHLGLLMCQQYRNIGSYFNTQLQFLSPPQRYLGYLCLLVTVFVLVILYPIPVLLAAFTAGLARVMLTRNKQS